MKLASLGSIRDAILHLENIAFACVTYLCGEYGGLLKTRFKLSWEKEEMPTADKVIEQIGRNRGFLKSGGEVDYERSSRLLLKELRDGILGRITLERPDDPLRYWPEQEIPVEPIPESL
jgi:ribosome biogenesis GTPase A